jgi:hypothetical protein
MSNLTEAILILVGLVLSAGAVIFVSGWSKKNNISFLNDNIDTIKNIIYDCVVTTNSTFVNELKKNDTFDTEAAQKAFEMTLASVKKLLGDRYTEVIEDVYDDVDEFFKVQIERAVESAKF